MKRLQERMYEMKKFIRNLLMVMMIALAMARGITVQASDVTDMKMGTKYNGNLNDESNSSDWYKFSLDQPGVVTFEYELSDEYAIQMSIYDKDKVKLLSAYCHQRVDSKTYRFNAGTYYLKAEIDRGDSATYTILPSFKEEKETFYYNNEFISDIKSKSAIPYSTWIKGQLTVTEENDYYKVVVPKAGKIKLEVANGNGSKGVYIYQSSKKIEYIPLFANDKKSVTCRVKKGIYYIKFSKQPGTGTYKFKVTATSSPLASMTVKKASATSMVVKANKAGAVSGYEIRYKKSSGSWKKIRVSGSKKLNKKIKKLKKGGTYTVQIRTYYTYKGTKIYSDWSSKRKVKLK